MTTCKVFVRACAILCLLFLQEKMDTLPVLLTSPPEGEEVKEEDKNKNTLPSNSKKWKK